MSTELPFFSRSSSMAQPLNGVVLGNTVRPLAERHSAVIVDLEADGVNHLQIVVHDLTAGLVTALGLNYSEIPNSCCFL